MKLYYKDENVEVLVCEITTNHSMSVDDMLNHCDIDMDDFADKQGWDGWDWGALEISASPSIKELRTSTGMTQTEFGEYLNIPMRTIQNWEGGQRNCPEYVIELIKYKIDKEELCQLKN